jgi:hypothetical protein
MEMMCGGEEMNVLFRDLKDQTLERPLVKEGRGKPYVIF